MIILYPVNMNENCIIETKVNFFTNVVNQEFSYFHTIIYENICSIIKCFLLKNKNKLCFIIVISFK